MKDFIVTGEPLFLYAGVIGLTPSQAARRSYGIRPGEKKGEFEIVSRICFKQGEIIGLPAPVGKTIRHLVEPLVRKTED